MRYAYTFCFLTGLFFGSSCNGPAKTDLRKETAREMREPPQAHPKLIKTIGSPRYGNVRCILQDKAGNRWFGTTENGLYKYDGTSFSRFLVGDGLNSNNIFCLLEDRDGKIWIGTTEGLCVYDGKTFTEIRIPLPKNQPRNKNDLYSDSHWVFSIMQAKNGKLWFATIDGVYVYDGRSFTPFTIKKGGPGFASSNHNVEQIFEDNSGNMWFGGRGNEGVYRYDGSSVVNLKIKGPGSIPDSIARGRNWAWPQLQDKNGDIWFSNWDGAYRYDGTTVTSVTKNDGLPGTGMVTRIIQDKNGDLWFGGSGLSRYDGRTFTQFTRKDGLPDLGVWSILEDKTGDLWVGTRETGLYLYNGKDFETYSEYK